MVQTHCPDPEVQETLLKSLYLLEHIFTEIFCSQGHEQSSDPGIAWKWPFVVGAAYTTLLREQNEAALVIYAHFALLSHNWNDRWYLEGWRTRIVNSVKNCVGPVWQEYMRWPVEQVRNGIPIFDFSGSGQEKTLVPVESYAG
jgi:hypothetical protein